MWSDLFGLLETLFFILAILAAFILGYKLRRDEPIYTESYPDEIIDQEETDEKEEILEY